MRPVYPTEPAIRTRPLRVLVVVPTLEVGGAEMDLVRNLPRIDRSRFELITWPFHAPGELAAVLEQQGLEVLPSYQSSLVNKGRSQSLSRVLSAGASLAGLAQAGSAIVRRGKVDVIHAILPNAYLVAALASILSAGRPLVMSRLSQNWYHKDLPLLGALERHVLHRFTTIAIGNASAILDELRDEGVPDRKLRLVRNGIDVEGFTVSAGSRTKAREALSISPTAFVMTSVANLHRYKGHRDLLAAVGQVRNKLGPEWRLLVVGADRQGSLGELRDLAIGMELEKNIRFLGGRNDVPELLAAADLHVSASHSEGLPNNILEAMSAGLPVVATRVGGVPELVEHNSTGFLVPSHDPEQLGTAIATFAMDESLRKRLGAAGRSRAHKEFSIEGSVSSFETIYEQAWSACMKSDPRNGAGA